MAGASDGAALGGTTVRAARTDDGPRLAHLLAGPVSDVAAVADGADVTTLAERATSLVPDADEVGRLLLVAERAGEVVGYATLVWIHQLRLPGPEAHVAELEVGATDDPQAVVAALRHAVRDRAGLVGAARIGGPAWERPSRAPVVRELPVGETALAVPALRELRPHLSSDDAVVAARIDGVQRPEGYRLLAVLPDDDRPAAAGTAGPAAPQAAALAVAGFRRLSTLAWGDILYVDDLVTRDLARGRGCASALLGAIDDEARRLGLAAVHLDSGHGPDRTDAHRAYLRHGYRISSHHLSRELPGR